MSVERIVPADLDGDDLWRRNGEYVSADAYDAAVARIAELEAALKELSDLLASSWDRRDLAPDIECEAVEKARKLICKS